MHDWRLEFAAIAIAHALAVAGPGPDFALVLRQSLAHGRSAALMSAVGIGCGTLLHVAVSLLGFAFVVRNSPAVFAILKYAGAAYLCWLGWQALKSGRGGASVDARDPIRATPRIVADWWRGFLTNALNPKATLFFLALFSVVISPLTPKFVQVGYGLWMALVTIMWFACVALLLTRPEVRRAYFRMKVWVDRLTGVVFIGFAVTLIVARSP
jgi:RhtB (resistance to homoserine/threonine) family protein